MSKDQVTEHIRVDLDGAVAVVTMAKPPHNLLNGSFIEDLLTAFEEAAANGARAILLRSEMKHFSAGADVDGFGGDGRDGGVGDGNDGGAGIGMEIGGTGVSIGGSI